MAPGTLCKLKDLPEHLQFNKDILTGYRRPMSAKDCVRSWKYLHNESFNCYSHSKHPVYCEVKWWWVIEVLFQVCKHVGLCAST